MLILFSVVALAVALIAGCGRAPDDTDADKRRQIEERYVSFEQAFPSVRGVSAAEFIELIECRPLVIVDVRPDEERDVSMIPDAVSKGWFKDYRDQYRDRLVVTYCTIGAQNGQFAVKLQQEGFDVVNLRGSILVWVHTGRPLVDKDGRTKRVPVFSADWNLLPASYDAVWQPQL